MPPHIYLSTGQEMRTYVVRKINRCKHTPERTRNTNEKKVFFTPRSELATRTTTLNTHHPLAVVTATTKPLTTKKTSEDVFAADLWPSPPKCQQGRPRTVGAHHEKYARYSDPGDTHHQRLSVRRQGRRALPSIPPKGVLKARPVGDHYPPLQVPLLPQQTPRHPRGAALPFPNVEEIVPLERFQAPGRPLPVAGPADQQRPGPELVVGIFLGYSLERPALRRRERRPPLTEPVVDLLRFFRGQPFYPRRRTRGVVFGRRCWNSFSAAPAIRRLRAWFVWKARQTVRGAAARHRTTLAQRRTLAT